MGPTPELLTWSMGTGRSVLVVYGRGGDSFMRKRD